MSERGMTATGGWASPPPHRWRPPRWLVDLAAPAVLELPATASVIHMGGGSRWWVWLLEQALILPLVARRRHPVLVFGFQAAVALLQWVIGVRLAADFALLVALYTIAAQRERRQALIAAGVLECGVILASARFAPAGGGVLGSIVFLSGLVTASLFLGTTLQTRRAYLASLEERTRQLERERDQQAQLAATAERTRIAREMHDIVAHSLSVVIALAHGAALAVRTEPAEAEQAMRQVADTGRQALAEMRRLLDVLHDGTSADLSPQPTLARLNALLDDVRAAGLPVRLVQAGAVVPLPPTAEATIYRVVQEALTNILKHSAEPSEARVALTWLPDEVTVEVADDGRTPAPVPGAHRPVGHGPVGHGLQGMRERVALFGGQLSAGPMAPHGWAVRATLRTADRPQ